MMDTGWVAAMAGAGLAGVFPLGSGRRRMDWASVRPNWNWSGRPGGRDRRRAGAWAPAPGWKATAQPASRSAPAGRPHQDGQQKRQKRAVRCSTRACRAGGSVTAGLAESTMVGSFKLPPRGMVFQPLLAAHAFSSARRTPGRWGSAPPVFRQAPAQHALDGGAERRVQPVRRRRFFRHNLIDHSGQVLAGVGLLAGQHFERDHRQRELIRAPSTGSPCTCSGDM